MQNHYDNICAVADYFGLSAQIEKAIEEVKELLFALKSGNLAGEHGVLEEAADVYNMLDQICYLTNAEEFVQDIAEKKMQRTVERIGGK